MQLSRNKLLKLRSGATVWKCWANASLIEASYNETFERALARYKNDPNHLVVGHYELHVSISRLFFSGKPTMTNLGGEHYAYWTKQMLRKPSPNPEWPYPRWGTPEGHKRTKEVTYVNFVNDAGGFACFDQAKQALRWKAEFLSGLYPKLVDSTIDGYLRLTAT